MERTSLLRTGQASVSLATASAGACCIMGIRQTKPQNSQSSETRAKENERLNTLLEQEQPEQEQPEHLSTGAMLL
jgi:hypothetical protein